MPMGKALFAGVLLFIGFVACLIVCFEYQAQLEAFLGIRLTQISMIPLMIVLAIPWIIMAWVFIRKFAHYGILSLFTDRLTITSIESKKMIRNYPASAIVFVKIQQPSFRFTFQENNRLNSINMSVDKDCQHQLIDFNPVFHAFIQRNKIPIQEGVVL